MTTTRRQLLIGPAALALGAASAAPPAGTAPPRPTPANSGLHRRAQAKGRFYGSAIDKNILRGDAGYMAAVPRECGILVSETAFKWSDLRPRADAFDYAPAEMLMAYAARHNMAVRGHALAWHVANPKWLEQSLNPGNAERILSTHIRTVVGHFRHRLVHWDVVNEVLWPQDGKPQGLRDSLWLRALGPRYIDIAFQTCAETDPGALRCINEYGLDYALPDDDRKRGAMLDLLADLLHRGIPVQALGMQAHLDAGVAQLDQKILAKFCDDVTAMGLKLLITEMDVRDNRLPANTATRDAAVAAHGRAYLDAVLANHNVLGVLTWGLSDRRTWLNDELPRTDKLPQRPLPLDTELQRKPLWTQMAAAFDMAPARG